jgi:hypothetical protein
VLPLDCDLAIHMTSVWLPPPQSAPKEPA